MSFTLRRQTGVNLTQEPTNPFKCYGLPITDELAEAYDKLRVAIDKAYDDMGMLCIDPFIDYLRQTKENHIRMDELNE